MGTLLARPSTVMITATVMATKIMVVTGGITGITGMSGATKNTTSMSTGMKETITTWETMGIMETTAQMAHLQMAAREAHRTVLTDIIR